MFLVDKYFNDSNQYVWHHSIIEKILDSFDTQTNIYLQIEYLNINKDKQIKKIEIDNSGFIMVKSKKKIILQD